MPAVTKIVTLLVVCLMLAASLAEAQAPQGRSVALEDLTWTELRDRIAGGATIVLVPIGGTEQNGPHMTLGKHNVRARLLAEKIALVLGNAIVAPVVAYAPEDGKLIWSCEGLRFKKGDLAYSTPVIVGDTLVTVGGYNGPNLGVKLGGSGDITATNRLWLIQNNPQSIGSGVAIDGHVYMPFAGLNTIECIDPKTGKSIWKEKQKSAFWGSIVVAGGKAYVTDQEGRTVVFKPNPEKFEAISTNELGEKCNATPAISNGEIFIRTFKALYCIAE